MTSLSSETGALFFSYSAPLYQAEQADGTKETIAIYSLSFGILIFLNSLLNEGNAGRGERTIQQDQLELFLQIEDNISTMGVDGHVCVLRFICEMQLNRFSKSSMFGELFTLMFTPKQGDDYTILKDYIEAEMVGLDGDTTETVCQEKYYTCPISVFAALRKIQGGLGFSTPSDKPLNTTIINHFRRPDLTLENDNRGKSYNGHP
ncbi:hypothetical protein SK128_000917 [Halocaridina rubra]|uniref:Uncharacterized protein n=1 Tax=Halocaridina rubra TaxID=373956 RepID=A0AAN8X9C8_HALRR